MSLILYHPNGTAPTSGTVLRNLTLLVSDATVRQITSAVDESYTLTFTADLTGATVSATTIFGARHGLESFSQLVDADRLTGQYSVSAINIVEAPRFPHRGLLIDSARHPLDPSDPPSLSGDHLGSLGSRN